VPEFWPKKTTRPRTNCFSGSEAYRFFFLLPLRFLVAFLAAFLFLAIL
jgi:hypothetical protein